MFSTGRHPPLLCNDYSTRPISSPLNKMQFCLHFNDFAPFGYYNFKHRTFRASRGSATNNTVTSDTDHPRSTAPAIPAAARPDPPLNPDAPRHIPPAAIPCCRPRQTKHSLACDSYSKRSAPNPSPQMPRSLICQRSCVLRRKRQDFFFLGASIRLIDRRLTPAVIEIERRILADRQGSVVNGRLFLP